MTVTSLLEQACNKSDNVIKLVTTCSTTVNNLFQQLGTSSAKTSCWQLVNRLVTICLQICYKLCVFTCVDKAVEFIKLVASLLQTCSNLSTSWEQTERINLVTSLLQQACYKSAAGLLQVVRFCVCSSGNFVHMEERTSCQQVVLATSL